jgi:hypothetical protein
MTRKKYFTYQEAVTKFVEDSMILTEYWLHTGFRRMGLEESMIIHSSEITEGTLPEAKQEFIREFRKKLKRKKMTVYEWWLNEDT